MAEASPDWSSAAQESLQIWNEEVFETEDSLWRPIRSNRLADENREESSEYKPRIQNLDTFAEEHQEFINDSEGSLSFLEGEGIRSGSTVSLTTPSNFDRDCSAVQSESSQRGRSWSDHVRADSAEKQQQQRPPRLHHVGRQPSIVDDLLLEIYDQWHRHRTDSQDSDTFTEYSSASEVFHGRWEAAPYDTGADNQPAKHYHRHFLQTQTREQLQALVQDFQRSVMQTSTRLVRQLKRRDRRVAKMSRHCDVVTAILQAASLKRQIDTRMKFSLAPGPGQSAFEQWKDAMKAVNRLPMGIPAEFRKKVWLNLADHYIGKLKIDWHKTVRLAFNDRSNPDDDKLGLQIVKDLHRTGCSSFSGQDNEQDRAVLKRVLLAYARWNKRIGYCQGFNVIAALLLNVMDRKEDDAFKVMIYLIDHVLPESYFDNNLRALSVDMAVFRDLLRLTLPTLSTHLDSLQHAAQDISTGACYEPPLTNVFTMQWFLTLFATCLPKEVVLRVWDAILLEGSEVLLRTALCLWGRLARRIMTVESADEFYSVMGELSSDMMEGTIFDSDDMIKAIYAVAPVPFPQLTELREKYTYNIRPFSTTPAPTRKLSRLAKAVLYSDEEEPDEEELRAMAAFPGMLPVHGTRGKGTDISVVGPGVFGVEPEVVPGSRDTVYMERMTTDITALKMQYRKLRQRQRQAHVIIAAVSAKKAVELKQKSQAPVSVPKIESPLPMNHLFVGKVQGRNRQVIKGPCVGASSTPGVSGQTQPVRAQSSVQSYTTNPTATTPAGTSSSSTPDVSRGGGEGKESLQGQLEESLQICEMDRRLCNGSSSENAESGTGNADKNTSVLLDCGNLVTDVRPEDQSDRTVKPNHLPPSSKGVENQALGSNHSELDTVFESLQPTAFPEKDSTYCLDKADEQHLQHTQLSGSHFSQQKEDSGMIIPASKNGVVSNIKSSHLDCENPKTTAGDFSVGSSVPVTNSTGKSSANKALPKNLSVDGQTGETETVSKTISGVGDISGDGIDPQRSHVAINRSLSLPAPSTTAKNTLLSPTATPTHKHPTFIPTPAGVKVHHVSSPLPSPNKTPRPFNPFPVKHINTNRARTGLKLGLYTPSTLEHIQGQLLGGLVLKKARNASS